jgi:N-carbamoyl-L-amino-acid hydrolase
MRTLFVNPERLQAKIDELAAITEGESPAVTRVLFSPRDLEARAWIEAECRQLGLTTRVDAVGNFFARWEGSEPALAPLATGSHLDAIPGAGRYDGVLGVLGALEAFRALKGSGFVPRRSIELIVFTAEEPTRFGLGCLGSRLLSGALTSKAASELADKDGTTLPAWLEQMKFGGDGLGSVRLPDNAYRAFVELHIEQGPLLEQEGLDLGIVEKIAAPSSFRLGLEGEGGHAGAVLMPARRDALMGACEIALAIEKAARDSTSPDTVATVGVMQIQPGAINSIPFQVGMEVDLRDTDVNARARALGRIDEEAEEIAKRRDLKLTRAQINLDPPALADAELVESVLRQAAQGNFKARRMISRAYHDSLFMALLCPFTMIFVPCRGGVSHRPDEYSSPEQMAAGVSVLARALAEWSWKLA